MKKLSVFLCAMVLASGVFGAANLNSQPCVSDLDGDGAVGLLDFVIFKSEYFSTDCDPYVQLPITGQTTCYDSSGNTIACTGTGQDGDHQTGVSYPNPRFTDNLDGTVTDNLTSLVWFKDANRFGTRTWTQALSDCNGLADDGVNLTDGSAAGDWRLPNRSEMESLLCLEYYNPAMPNTAGTGKWTSGDPFTNVQSLRYWSSTTYADSTDDAWYVDMYDCDVDNNGKPDTYYVWPVRDAN